MRILHVPQAYAPVRGGGEWHCQRVSEGLAERGHDVQVVTGNVQFPSMYSGENVRKAGPAHETLNGVRIERIPYGTWATRFVPLLKRWPIPARGALRKLARRGTGELFEARFEEALLRHDADVVMAMAHTQFNVQCLAKLRGKHRFPYVFVPLIHADSEVCQGELMGSLLARADAIVANTAFEKDWIHAHFGIPRERMFVGLLGVDAPETAPEGERGKTLLYFGRKDPLKGIDLLIDAFARVLPRHPDARLVIAGARWPGSEKIDGWIAAQPEAVRARIDSHDNVSDEEREDLLGSARCLVLPSEEESFGLVLIEAWARNTPIVTLDKGVFRSFVDEGVDGRLSPPRNPDAMADDLDWMLAHPAEAAAMGAAGRRKCLSEFTWDQVARRYEEAYRYAREHTRPS